MSNDNQTQRAREAAEKIGQKVTWRLCKDEGEYNDAQSQITTIILRALNGSEQPDVEVRAVLDSLGADAVRVREDAGHEDIYASLAVSVAKLQKRLSEQSEYRRGVLDAAKVVEERHDGDCDYHKPCEWLNSIAVEIRALLTTEQGVSGRGDAMLERMEAECGLRLQVRIDSLMEQGYSENHARIIAEEEDKPTISAVAPAGKE